MTKLGIILVSDDSITVRGHLPDDASETIYREATIENLQDAARIIAIWMELSKDYQTGE